MDTVKSTIQNDLVPEICLLGRMQSGLDSQLPQACSSQQNPGRESAVQSTQLRRVKPTISANKASRNQNASR